MTGRKVRGQAQMLGIAAPCVVLLKCSIAISVVATTIPPLLPCIPNYVELRCAVLDESRQC